MDLHAFENCTCFNLRKATRALTQIYDDALRPIGIGANQVAILAIVSAKGPIPMGELAFALVMDRTTLTRNLKPLQQSGYLNFQEGEDRRQRLIVITDNGRHVLTEAEPVWKEIQTRIAKSLGLKKWSRLLGDLNQVTHLS